MALELLPTKVHLQLFAAEFEGCFQFLHVFWFVGKVTENWAK